MMTLRTNKARLFSLTSLFVLISWSAFAQNLIINGSFEQGNITSNVVGFETHYNKYEVSPPGNALSNAGDVTITSDPKLMNTTFIAQSGTRMLVVDGSMEAGKRLWGKEYQIKKGVDYIFSYWIKPVSSSVTNDINTQASVALWLGWNGELGKISPTVRSGAIGSDWKQVIFTVNIPGTGSQWVPFVLTNENTSDAGNDFALDNLSLIPPQPPLKITYSKFNGTCGEDGIIAIYGVGGYKPYKNYTISGPNLPTGYTNSNTTGIFSNLPTGTYAISVTDQKNTTVNETGIVITTNQITIIKNPDKTNYCPGDNITLTASGGQIPYTWTKNPTLPIISTPNANPLSVQPNANTTYTVTSTITTTPTELIYNGDFSLGEEGFYSDYEWYPGQNDAFAQRAYGVTNNAQSWASVFQACIGNGGAGNFLVADGSIYNPDTLGNGTDIVWQQAVPVKPNTNYTFSYYLSSLVSNNPAQIITKINGIEVGTNTASSSTCVWNQVSYSWNSGSNTVAVITLIDKNTQASGNDFGLDDMSFKQVGNSTCNVTKDVTINVSSGTSTFSYTKNEVCQGVVETLTPDKTGGTWSVSPSTGLNVDATTGVITLNATTAFGDYTITRVIGCTTGDTKTFAFKVKPKPILPKIPIAVEVCPNTEIDVQARASLIGTIPAGATFTWTTDNTTVGIPDGSTDQSTLPKFTAINNGTTVQTAKVTVTPKLNGCTGDPEVYTLVVNPNLKPTVTCGNSTQTSVIFNWSAVGDATGYDISYKITPSGGTQGSAITNSTSLLTFTVNSLNPDDSVEFTLTPKGGKNCFTPATQTCVAENCPTISNPSAKISVCSDDTTTHTLSTSTQFTGANAIKFVYFSTKQTGNAMYSGGTSLGTATPSSGSASLTIPKIGDAGSIPTTAGTYYIYAIANPNPASTSCRPFAEIEFEVKPKPVVTAISDITVCNGETINAITFTDDLTGSTFEWKNDNTAIGLAANGTVGIPQFTATNTTNAPVTATITVTSTNNSCKSDAKTFKITVNPKLKPTIACGNSTQTSVIFNWSAVGDATGYDISYKITPSGGTQGSAITNSTSLLTFTVNSLNPDDSVEFTLTPKGGKNCFTPATQTCVAENCPTISNPSAKISVCSDDTTTHTLSTSTQFTGANAIKFVYFSTKQTGNAMYSGGTSLGTATPSSGSASLTIPKIGDAGSIPSTARTYYIYAIANPNPASASCRPFAEIEFEVKPKPVINTISNITVCNGKTVNAITFGDNLTGSTFAWSSNNNTIGLAASGTGDIAQFTATNTTTSQITATISVTSTNNSCTSEAKTFTITVNPTVTPIVDFSYTTPICKLDTTNPTPIKATGFSNLGTFAVTSFNASDLVFVSTSTGEIDLANTKAGIYDIKYEVPADATTCRILQSKTFQIEITDKITPVVEFTYPAAVCIGTTNPTPSPIDATKPLTTGGTFAVTSLNASDLKFVSNSTGEIDLTQTKAGIYTIKYSVTKTGCQDAGISTDVSIEIQQNPTISLKSAANTDKQEICEDTALTPIEYEILNGTGAKLTITPTTAEITGSYNPTTKIFTISGTPTTKADYTYEVETIGNCTQSKLTGTIKVKEDDSLVLTSDAATTNQTKCISTAITDIVYTYGGGATGVTVTGLQTSNYTINTTNKTVTISFTTPSTAQTINYSITTTSTNGSCKAKTLSGKITVTDLSNQVLTFTYAKASYCKSDTPNPIAVGDPNFVTGGTYSATPNTLVFVDDKTGEIDLSQTPVGTYQIKYTVLQDLANCKAGGTSPNVQVEIKPDATLVLNSAARTDSQIVCVNKPITDIVYEFGGGATNATVTGLPAGINLTIDTTQKTVTITGTPTATGTFTYKVNTTGTCEQKELTGIIEVKANEVIETEFIYPASVVCKNDTTNPQPFPKDVNKPLTTGGKYTSTTGLVIDADTGVINLTTSTAGTYKVTYTINDDPSKCRLTQSSTFDITIKALPTIPTITGGKTICTGTSTDITIKGDAGSSVVYSIDGVNQGAVILNINGEYTFPTGNLSQKTTYKIIDVSHGSTPLCTVNLTTNVQTIVDVLNPPTATIISDAKICINTGTQITFTGTPNAVVTYAVLSGLTTTTKTVTLNAQGKAVINTGNLSVDTRYRIEKVGITSAGTTCEAPITNQIAVITINVVPVPLIPTPQYFCETLNAKVGNLNDTGLTSPKWYNASNVVLNDTDILQNNQTYYVTQTIDGCESVKVPVKVILVPLAPNNLIPEIQICSIDLLKGVTLDTGLSSADYDFLWTTPTLETKTTSSIFTKDPGEHKVLISKKNVQNCGVTYSTFIRAFGTPKVIEIITGLNKFEILAEGTDLPIEYSLDQQHWQTSNVFENLEPGDYIVYARGSNAKCAIATDATVLGMPNVVIPNGKDKNQKWTIHGIRKFPGTYIRIYDRYGKLIKEHIVDGSTDFTWDGTYLNRPLPSTSYWYDVLFPSGKKISGYILLKNR